MCKSFITVFLFVDSHVTCLELNVNLSKISEKKNGVMCYSDSIKDSCDFIKLQAMG